MGMARVHYWVKLQSATLSGFLKPEDLLLPLEDITCRMTRLLWAQISKLMTYQLVATTILRVNNRCDKYRTVAPAELMLGQRATSGINDIVCGYLGEVTQPNWYGTSFNDAWSARVTATNREDDNKPEDLMPLGLSRRIDRCVYVRSSPEYWEMPWE